MKRFAQDGLAALISAIVAITYSLSYGALIFSGPLGGELSQGITLMLVTAAVSAIVVAAGSSFRFAIGGPDSNVTAVFTAIAASIGAALPSDPALGAREVVLILMITGITGGAALVALGHYRLGRWIRYIPYPIVAGFLAATGWLLLNGSLRVIADVSFPMRLAPAFTPSGAVRLLVGALFAVVLYVTRRARNPLVLPALLIGGAALLDLVFLATGTLPNARGAGWFVQAFGAPHLTSVLDPAAYAGISWPLLRESIPAIATAITVAVIALLFNAAGVETQTEIDADLDRELRASGLASMLSAVCGGFVGLLSSSRTLLNVRAGAQTRAAGIAVGLLCAAALAGGSPLIALMPRPVLGGLLLSLGYGLLRDWLVVAWRRLSRLEFVLVLAIIVITGLSSFVNALILGLLFSCVTFAIRYGRFRAIRHALSAHHKRSRVERGGAEHDALEAHGGEIRMLVLQGYIFFGTANAVLDQARTYLDPASSEHARYLILDFAAVSGIDSSAGNSFAKLATLGQRAGTRVVFCSLSEPVYDLLVRGGVTGSADDRIFPDLDRALERCEDDLLASLAGIERETVPAWLARELDGSARAAALLAYFETVTIAAGAPLFRRGDPSDSLSIVASGRLRVSLNGTARDHRLREMTPGSFVGEMGLFTHEPRSADVIAETDAELYRLSRAALDRMYAHDPVLANAFGALLFRLQAQRLRFASGEIAALEA
jgi:SulP family sulfate permease